MPRLIFANQLRGLAALCVVGSHLVAVFWAMRDVVGIATASPPQPGDGPPFLGMFLLTWFNLGPFGVGIFFLISGLVIPMSLAHYSRGGFLIARVLRIYPTYVAALLLEMIVIRIAGHYWGRPFLYDGWAILSNALLIYNTVGEPPIDLVNWTLCVEVKFYLLMMLLAPQIRRGSVPAVLSVGLAVLAANVVVESPDVAGWIARPDLVKTLSTESVFIVFMLIGVLLNFHLRRLLSLFGFALSGSLTLGLFLLSWQHSALREQFPVVPVNYLYALVLFTALFFLRRFARPLPIIDFVARISYPVYLIHSLIGFSVLKISMLGLGLAYLPALGITVMVVFGTATLLHVSVEARTIAIGRTFARSRVRDDSIAVTIPNVDGSRASASG